MQLQFLTVGSRGAQLVAALSSSFEIRGLRCHAAQVQTPRVAYQDSNIILKERPACVDAAETRPELPSARLASSRSRFGACAVHSRFSGLHARCGSENLESMTRLLPGQTLHGNR